MEVQAKAKWVRTSPRKVRLVAHGLRNLPVGEALTACQFMPRAAARDVAKVIRSAQANAENNFNLVRDDLVIKEIRVEAGPMLKRGQPRAMGRLFSIFKRTSHITAVIEDRPGAARRRPASLPRAPQGTSRPAPSTPAPSRRGTRATAATEPATTESDQVEEAPKPRRTRGETAKTKADQAKPEKGKTSTQSSKKDDVKKDNKDSKEKKGK